MIHNKNKILVKYIGHSEYESKHYQKDNVLSFIRNFTIILSLTMASQLVSLYNTDSQNQFLNPVGGPSVFGRDIKVQAQEIEPVPVNPCADLGEIETYICEVFEEDYQDAMTILSCENQYLEPDAEHWNTNGSWDAGIFQINSIHGFSMEEMKKWKNNIDFAHKLFHRDSWSAWACSHTLNIKSFWQ